jgi:hypothetical protein
MTQANKPPEQRPAQPIIPMKFGEVGVQVAGITLGIVLLSVFGGLWLDRILGTKPILTVILVVSSAPLSLFLTVWVAMRAVRDLPSRPEQKSPQANISKEDTSDD